MSKRRNQHVVKHPSGWAIKGAGNFKATKVLNTQAEAISIAKEIAKNQNAELVIHGRNVKIREKNSYGDDTFPPKG